MKLRDIRKDVKNVMFRLRCQGVSRKQHKEKESGRSLFSYLFDVSNLFFRPPKTHI